MNVELANIIKQIANNSVMANKPATVKFGVVMQESPLKIKVDQKLILTEEFLVLSRNVTDYEFDMTVNHTTEKMQKGGKDPAVASHKHMYKGRKTFLVHNKLRKDENVILLGVQGGQTYVVLDRVGV